jgi:hypothetical protein
VIIFLPKALTNEGVAVNLVASRIGFWLIIPRALRKGGGGRQIQGGGGGKSSENFINQEQYHDM